jgi:hypothetical protein
MNPGRVEFQLLGTSRTEVVPDYQEVLEAGFILYTTYTHASLNEDFTYEYFLKRVIHTHTVHRSQVDPCGV